ncbi:zinc-binding alcohol dehydrogenase [soil metagenome]
MSARIDALVEAGEIGGRTVRVSEGGDVECHTYPVAPLAQGCVRVRTTRSAISAGTELTYIGGAATNVHLHRRWDARLRLFVDAGAGLDPPLVFGYRATGRIVESGVADLPAGTRIYGKWRHTEYVALAVDLARAQRVPEALEDEDAVDLAHMAPICVNAVAEAEDLIAGRPAVVFGAGTIGLITAQVARASGATEVVVVDRLAERLEVADHLGLETILAREDVAVRLKRDRGPDAFPVAFECTGAAAGLHEAIRTVAPRGRVIAVGFYQGGAAELELCDEFHHNAVRVVAAQIGNIHPAWTIETLRARAIALTLARRLVLGALPRLELPVERAREGFAALRRPAEVLQVALRY